MDYEQDKQVSKRIIVTGIVQGVGFRPYVYHLCKKHSVYGTVRNLGGQVEIIATSALLNIENLLQELRKHGGNTYEILSMDVEDIPVKVFSDFKIIKSGSNHDIAIIPPDLPMCRECEKELYQMGNKRYENPFISCAACGPRYTIIKKLPYDRINTTMKEFAMCPSCKEEYTSPDSRRFHAQTISCNDCGPYLIFNELSNRDAFMAAVTVIKSGGIIGVKGIGGYHYACSPMIEETVMNLRKLKGREEKPFAVMFPNMKAIEEYCISSKEEKKLLESNARPIVLLRVKEKKMAESTGKGSLYCGAFLPYTSLQKMLLDQCGPLIMTSANLSGQPIIKEDNKILSVRSPYLKGVLYHTRQIIRSVDDSVAKVIDKKPQLIRRSRGFAPYPLLLGKEEGSSEIFAAGSDLKGAFCLYKKGYAYVSQYFGDLEEKAIFDEYRNSYYDLKDLLSINPDKVVCDMHPGYHSSRYAETLGLPVLFVQHHHAHIASVMAEHNLRGKVIGVAMDGTGYGVDGNIWGSEFLLCEGSNYKRAAHLRYTNILGGDSSMKDGRKTATCFLYESGITNSRDERSNVIQAAVKNHVNTVLSSSMGRLFDAAASILRIRDYNTYEGECAIELEKEATLASEKNLTPPELFFAIHEGNDMIEIDYRPLLKEIYHMANHMDAGIIALAFHNAVAHMILKVCEIMRKNHGTNVVAMSGGVFQNSLLTDKVLRLLRREKFIIYMNRIVPPGDGCISLGQTYIGTMSK